MELSNSDSAAVLPFLAGGGDMGRRIGAFDWAATSIGGFGQWPAVLRHTVSLMLRSAVPLVLLWGEDGVMIYNDAYAGFAGGRDATLLGSRVREGWGEVADFNDNVMKVGLAGGTLSYKGHELTLHRNGQPEQVWLDLEYSPVLDDSGLPAGVLAIVVETTEATRNSAALRASEARLRFFDELGRAFAGCRSAEETLAASTRMTAQHIGASVCAYAEVDEDEDGFTVLGDWHVEGAASLVGHYRLASFGESTMGALRTGGALVIEDAQNELPAAAASAFGALGVGATICVPLLKGGTLSALMAVHDRAPRRWTPYEQAVLHEVTERSWAHLERARAETRLAERESQLRRSQEAGGVGLFSIDVASDRITCTPEFCRIFGFADKDVVHANDVERLIVPDDRHNVSNSEKRRTGAAELDVEYRIRRANDGEERLIARKAEYEFEEAGKIVRLVGAVRDITERRRVQVALQRSEAGFSALAQHMPNQVWTMRADGSADWFNSQVYLYTGAPEGSLDNDRWIDCVHPDDRARTLERWSAAVTGGDTYETEFQIRNGEGGYRWFLVRGVPLRDAGGTIVAWVGTNTDIHEHKLLEQASMRDRNRLWSISRDLLMVCDFEGRITAINPSASRLLGWQEEQMLDRQIVDFVHPDDLAATACEIAQIAGGKITRSFENRCLTSSGGYRLFAWTAVPEDGRIHAVGRDITDQRVTEEALRQSQKMEAVGQLTGGIAHDFNNLLQGIVGSLDIIESRIAQGRTAELQRWLGGARSSAERAAALTHRLLAFSRRQPLDSRPVEANPLIGSMEDMLRRTLGVGISLQLDLGADLWLTRCDPNQLESAILNLAINSRDAMPDGGDMTISTRNFEVSSNGTAIDADFRPGCYVEICVHDSGHGMSRDVLDRAFEPFFTTKPVGQGTGLGLSMIYGFARQSEGYASIDSTQGRGTTVRLYLPRHAGAEAVAVDEPEPVDVPSPRLGEVVLVVEDEPLVRGLIADVLEELGYRVIEASDGNIGLEILQSPQQIDLLVSDIGLPGLPGPQLSEAARIGRPDLKVLFITGYADMAVHHLGSLQPGMAIMTKPFAVDALARNVREMIDKGTLTTA